jgi:hypothetical protein
MHIVTWIFLALMFGVVVFFRRRTASLSLPNTVTAIGVLGTFIGIFWGLYSFDVSDIQGSIPQLLEGLKFAFITSIAGMSLALGLRLLPALSGPAQSRGGVKIDNAGFDTIARLLDQGQAAAQEQHSQTAQRLDRLADALSGAGEGSLAGRIQTLQQATTVKQDELRQAFDNFAIKVAEDNSSALVTALSQVIRDFNTQLNEQFGDNFKQLNEAVTRVVDWQNQYTDQVEEMIGQFDRTLEGVKSCESSIRAMAELSESFGAIADLSGSFKDTSERLDKVLASLHDQTRDLSGWMKSFADLSENAQNAFPIIERNIEQLTTSFSASVLEATNQSRALVEESRTSLGDQLKTLQTTQTKVNDEIRQLLSQLHYRTLYGKQQEES